MASHNSIPVLAERTDIHKSCKSLETVVNVLNDYCEAANAIVILQRKLSKALREGATLKCHPDIVVNTLTASATVFESITEVYAKFVKVADKECEALNVEVRKWFKKLAKEEKAHDDKLAAANTKIKQAGLNYEKKAKRAARDAAEEHTRYINLLNTLGPEISQEKYNHGLFVTQRHISTCCSVASCFARVVDAEWLRHCEGVRRAAPSIGRLGEWKSLCEGEWAGSPPQDLPNIDSSSRFDLADVPLSLSPVDDDVFVDSVRLNTSVDQQLRVQDPYGDLIKRRPLQQYNSPPLATPIQFPTADDASDYSRGSEDRKTSLDHFPSPPTHFPIPPITSGTSPVKEEVLRVQLDRVHQSPSPSHSAGPSSRRVSAEDPHRRSRGDTHSRTSAPDQQSTATNSTLELRSGMIDQTFVTESSPEPSGVYPSPDTFSDVQKDQNLSSSHNQPASGAKFNEHEFGVRESTERVSARAQTLDLTSKKPVQRTDSTRSSGSIVAAMRNKFAQNLSSPPQSPTKPTTSAVNVSNIASRYQSKAPQATETLPPVVVSRREALYASARMPESQDRRSNSSELVGNNNAASKHDDPALQRMRLEQLEELDIREQQRQLRIKERELERERARLLTAASARSYANSNEYLSDSVEMLPPGQRPQHRTRAITSTPRYSYSTSHLVPPDSVQSQTGNHSQPRPASLVSTPIQPTSRSFAPYASASPVENLVRPQPNSKPKGWIRRLSMPVISSFDSSKKSPGVSQPWRTSLALPEGSRDGRLGRANLG